jgi:hypothetical protein
MTGGRKYFFRTNPDDRRIKQVLGYLNDFGHGKAIIEREGRFTVLAGTSICSGTSSAV